MRLVLCCLLCLAFHAAAAPPATQPVGVTDKLPHIQVDVKDKAVRVECESCNAHQDVGLEFFAPPPDLWRPRIDTEQGLADTAAWYQEQDWL